MSNNEQGRRTNRRKIIKGIGSGALLAGVPLSSARSTSIQSEKYIRLAKQRQEQDWSIQTWRTRLSRAGFNVKYSDTAIRDNSVGTNKLDKHESHLYVTYTESDETDWVNFKWSLNDGYDDWATDPLDYASISFDSSDYTRNTTYGPIYGDWVRPFRDRKDDISDTGVVVKYNSNQPTWSNYGRVESSFDLALDPEPNTSPSSRTVYVNYWHTWGSELTDIDIDGKDVDLDFNVGLHGGVWNRSANPDENQMKGGFKDK